jgi:hypothetical protein
MMLLRGTVAAIRCRDYLEAAALPEAKLELMIVEATLREVDELVLDAEGARERETLRSSARRLRALVDPGDAAG